MLLAVFAHRPLCLSFVCVGCSVSIASEALERCVLLNVYVFAVMHAPMYSHSMDNFKLCLRAIRYWADRRGIYSNKMGFLGGINCNILTAYVCQLYPRASASVLIHKFFEVYTNWKWPKPVTLCEPYQVFVC